MKYKSYAFWTSLAAAVVVLVNVIFRAFGISADGQIASDIIMAVCGILIVFGVVKMPSAIETCEESEEDDTKTETENKETENKTDTK